MKRLLVLMLFVVALTGCFGSNAKYKEIEEQLKEVAVQVIKSNLYTESGLPTEKDAAIEVSLNQLVNLGYMEEIKDPLDETKLCDHDQSYIKIRRVTDTDTKTVDDYEYDVYLACGKYKTKK